MRSYNGFTPQQRMRGDYIIKQAIKEGILPAATDCKCVVCGQDKGIRHYHTEDYTPEHIVEKCEVWCWRCHLIHHSRHINPEACEAYFESIKQGVKYPPVYKNNIRILATEHGIVKVKKAEKDEI